MEDKKKEEKDFGMTGDQVFRALDKSMEIAPENAILHINFSHMQLLHIHSRALSAHCECLGMNSENMWAAIANASPAYKSEHYFEVLQKWGLVDEKGESII